MMVLRHVNWNPIYYISTALQTLQVLEQDLEADSWHFGSILGVGTVIVDMNKRKTTISYLVGMSVLSSDITKRNMKSETQANQTRIAGGEQASVYSKLCESDISVVKFDRFKCSILEPNAESNTSASRYR